MSVWRGNPSGFLSPGQFNRKPLKDHKNNREDNNGAASPNQAPLLTCRYTLTGDLHSQTSHLLLLGYLFAGYNLSELLPVEQCTSADPGTFGRKLVSALGTFKGTFKRGFLEEFVWFGVCF